MDRSKPPKAGPPKDVTFPEYYDTTLPNGINLIVITNNKIPAVSVRLVFKESGSYHDGEKYGLASVTAELLTKGTVSRSAEEIAEQIDYIGGSISSDSDWDGTFLSLSVLKKHLPKGIEILSDVLQNPVFPEDEITRIKEQRISSVIQNKSNPDYLSDRMFSNVVFGNHPYAHPSEGTEQSIKSISRPDIINFYRKHYKSGKLILAFVGDITREEALGITEKYFSNLPSGDENENKLKIYLLDDTKPNSVYIVDKPGAVQANTKLGNIGVKRNNPDYIKIMVMNTLLGGYFGSRINYLLREEHGFTYGARSGFDSRIYPGEFSVNADVRTEVTDTSVSLIISELKRIREEKVSEDELSKVKNYLSGIFPLGLETANSVASRVIGLKLYNLPKDYYNKYISEIMSVTAEDVLETARKYIKPDNLAIVVSGEAKVLKNMLAKFGEVKVFNSDMKPLELN
ncbi:MAG: insulinase family protein [Ignavibacteria bacterium]|nr:insulinase family protein [Ignavibacteria bacterium]